MSTHPSGGWQANPAPLIVAAAVTAVEGVAFGVLGLLGLVDLTPQTLSIGVSAAVFFIAYAALLLVSARALVRREGWARGPVLITQLLLVGIAWNARENWSVALLLVVLAVAGLVGLVHPSSISVLEVARGRDDDAEA